MDSYFTISRIMREQYLNTKKAQAEASYLCAWGIFRPVSFLLSPLFLRLGLSPNQLTTMNGALIIVALVLLCSGSYSVQAAGGLLLILSAAIDYCDGNIARFNGSHSLFGKFFDGLFDTLSMSHHFALAIGATAYTSSRAEAVLMVGIGGVVTITLIFLQCLLFRFRSLLAEAAPESPVASELITIADGSKTTPIRYLRQGAKWLYESWILSAPVLVGLFVLWGRPFTYVLLSFVIITPYALVQVGYLVQKSYRELGAPDSRSTQIVSNADRLQTTSEDL